MNRALQIVALIGLGMTTWGCQSGRTLLSGNDLSGWTEVGSSGAWAARDGELHCNGKMTGYAWLSTDRKYGDFDLSLEWRLEKDGNTGVFVRAPDREGRTSMRGFEVQARDDTADKDLSDVSGSVFRRIPASGRYAKPVGEWNRLRIKMLGRRLKIELNGHVASETDIDQVPPRDSDPPMSAVPDAGYIGLQNHGTPAAFRNISIREIGPRGG